MKRKAEHTSTPKGRSKKTKNRSGFSSVARTRGASVKGEMKYFDSERTLTAINSTADWTTGEYDPATLNTLFVPTVGAAVNQRIGKEVKVIKISIRGTIFCAKQANDTASLQATVVRYALVQDTQTNAAQAQGENVFSTQASAGASVYAHQNIDNFGRFRVLHDKVKVMKDPNMSYDGTNIEVNGLTSPFKMKHKFKKPVRVRFNAANGGTIADIVDNSWHIMANCSNTELVPQIQYVCRVYYKE